MERLSSSEADVVNLCVCLNAAQFRFTVVEAKDLVEQFKLHGSDYFRELIRVLNVGYTSFRNFEHLINSEANREYRDRFLAQGHKWDWETLVNLYRQSMKDKSFIDRFFDYCLLLNKTIEADDTHFSNFDHLISSQANQKRLESFRAQGCNGISQEMAKLFRWLIEYDHRFRDEEYRLWQKKKDNRIHARERYKEDVMAKYQEDHPSYTQMIVENKRSVNRDFEWEAKLYGVAPYNACTKWSEDEREAV